MAETLRNNEPDVVGRKRQGAVLAEGDVHSVDQRMAPAASAPDVKSAGHLLIEKIDHGVRYRLFSFRKDKDFAPKTAAQTVRQAFGPNELLGRRNLVNGKCDPGLFQR